MGYNQSAVSSACPCLAPPGPAFTGAIMLTASHMPWNANGLKVCGQLCQGLLAAIVHDALTPPHVPACPSVLHA
jgi:hypothetical protein